MTWAVAVAGFVLALRSAGRSEQTIALRRYHLDRLAAVMRPRGPWQVTGAQLVAWTGGQTWAAETRRSHRSSFTQFYRWAIEAGHTDTDPTRALQAVKPGQPRPRQRRSAP
ncbi:hypothetical protein [Occultella kanbiaonis]|uniref:hypothetical protein n=1 Tax=Occultella kanbiaonis TaxID=2675754 RepID=UPI00143D8899|nr:hypothetical protein [Occultella kanbiaonis]